MHRRGDANVDWDGINAAAKWIGEMLAAAGVEVRDAKEKWGTVRVYCDPTEEQRSAYARIYRAAIWKWPHLRAEIVEGADYPELLASEYDADGRREPLSHQDGQGLGEPENTGGDPSSKLPPP